MAISHISDTAGNLPQPLSTLPKIHDKNAANTKLAAIEATSTVNAVSKNDESSAHVEQAVGKIQETVNHLAQNLKFSIDEDTGKTVIKVMDVQTQEIIRQIPSQEAITIARTLDKIQGLLLNDKA